MQGAFPCPLFFFGTPGNSYNGWLCAFFCCAKGLWIIRSHVVGVLHFQAFCVCCCLIKVVFACVVFDGVRTIPSAALLILSFAPPPPLKVPPQ